jgi:hypothetical protein
MKNFGFLKKIGWDSVVAIFWPFSPLLHISMFHSFLLIFRVCLQVLRLVFLTIEFTDLWVFLSPMTCEGVPKLRRA